jgi:FtsP/CotA-like multicopper oxidase with cupredoxin domain
MSRNQRLGLVVLAVAVAAAGFLIARPSDEDEQEPPPDSGGGATQTQTETGGAVRTAPEPRRPRVERISVRGGAPRGGVRSIRYERGDTVRLVVTSDAQDEIHVHGYDITRNPRPGRPARFRFAADIEGVFDIESHVAEDAGREPLVARLVVEP